MITSIVNPFIKYKYLCLLILFIVVLIWIAIPTCKPVSFEFKGEQWHFPSTIGQAADQHHLHFVPPAGYYRNDSNGMETIISFKYKSGDFDNDRQKKEVLYSRSITAYVFRFPEYPGTYDSLKLALENQYNTHFVLTKGIEEFSWTVPGRKKPFQYDFLKIDDCLTIGIKRSSPTKNQKKVVVKFMYSDDIQALGTLMGSY